MSSPVVGYQYQAEIYCPVCLLNLFGTVLETSAEDVLNREAERLAVDRSDENTFDSGDFPKEISRQSAESDSSWGADMRCGCCNADLLFD